MDAREHYLQQSAITEPGRYSPLLDDLPGDIGGLCSAVRGLVLHHLRGEGAFGVTVSEDRRQELNTCFVCDMLERMIELDNRPLTEPRPVGGRLLGCCRDFAVLLCAIARHKGIPARVRFGFTPCREEGFNYDHVVTELWDAGEHRWVTVDPELGDRELAVAQTAMHSSRTFAGEFIPAPVAWQGCRQNATEADEFGRAPGESPEGAVAIRQSLLLDLAALNRAELLLWSTWGLMGSEQTEEEQLLDEVAELALAVDGELARLDELYQAYPGWAAPDPYLVSDPEQRMPELSKAISAGSRSATMVC